MAAEEVYQALLKLNSTSNSGLICEYNDPVKKRTRAIIGKPN